MRFSNIVMERIVAHEAIRRSESGSGSSLFEGNFRHYLRSELLRQEAAAVSRTSILACEIYT